jgi:GNAT superfamily N-acetyltransferase
MNAPLKAVAPCTVHAAGMDDMPELLRLLRLAHAEGGMFRLDESAVEETFRRALLDGKREAFIGVIRSEGREICAMIYVAITRYWYTDEFHVEESFNFVAPKHRQSNYADVLIRWAQHLADELGIPLVIGVLSNKRTEAKVRFYRRRLGMPAGAIFVHGAKWINERAVDMSLWRRVGGQRRKQSLPPLEATIATAIVEGRFVLPHEVHGG